MELTVIDIKKRSDVLKSNKFWSDFLDAGVIDLMEAERRAERTLVLKETYELDPWYAKKAERNPNFWSLFYSSRINW
jgi:hypothetical protein